MFGLWWAGSEVERYFGSRKFWRYYLFTGIGGALAAILFSWKSEVPIIGASGAIFGLLVAYGFLFPDRIIYLWFVVPIRAKYAVTAFGVVTLYFLWQGTSDGTSHIAHLGGLGAGLLWFFFMRGRGWFSNFFRSLQKRRMRRKLRLIWRRKNDDDNPMAGYTNKTVH
jgi:membrane associated rhomboid family serine protease